MSNSVEALYMGKKKATIATDRCVTMSVAMLSHWQAGPITVAMDVGHITTPMAAKDHSGNESIALAACCYERWSNSTNYYAKHVFLSIL
jgi:hypothetical protein